jgi:hypothetical protein
LLSAATANNLIVVVVGADDYRTAVPTGFTESTGCRQETFMGCYLWWKVAAGGETTLASYTIGSASPSTWIAFEVSGLTTSPYDISAGQLVASSGTSYTTPAIAPTAGGRYLIGVIGGSLNNTLSGVDTWLDSFVEWSDSSTANGSGTRDTVGAADRSVTGDGSTTFSTGATYSGSVSVQSRVGIIIAFKESAGGGPSSVTLTPAVVASAGVATTPVPQPVSVTLTPASRSVTAVPLTPVPQPVSVTLTPAALSAGAVATTPVPQPVTVALTPATRPLAAVAVTPVPGAVTVTLTPAVATVSAVAASTGAVGAVTLTPAAVGAVAVPVTATPTPVTVALVAAAAALSARALTPTPGPVAAAVAPALLAAVAVAVQFGDPMPGSMTGRPRPAGVMIGTVVAARMATAGTRRAGTIRGV